MLMQEPRDKCDLDRGVPYRGCAKPLLLPAMIGVGFVGGLISGPYLLLNLDVDVYYVSPTGRVYCWAFLCAIGTGLLAAVILTLTEHRGKPGSAALRGATWGFKRLLAMAALAAFPAFVFWGYAVSPREAAVRARCVHNIRVIVLALYGYQKQIGHLPLAFIPDEKGQPKHSWRVLILPYLEETGLGGTEGLKRLYAAYDFAEAWDGPHNRKLAHRMPMVYGCPGDPGRRGAATSYVVVVGEPTAFPGRRAIALDDIRDEKSTTLLVLEAANSGINWMEPRDFLIDQPELVPTPSHNWPGSTNPLGGVHIGFADGSVRFVRYTENNNPTLKALATINGGEGIDQSVW